MGTVSYFIPERYHITSLNHIWSVGSDVRASDNDPIWRITGIRIISTGRISATHLSLLTIDIE